MEGPAPGDGGGGGGGSGGGDPPRNNGAGGGGSGGGGDEDGGSSCGGGGDGNREGQGNGAVVQHDVFGDYNLGFVMLVLLLLHLMQYAMRDPCTC